jgi:hypothetical protein
MLFSLDQIPEVALPVSESSPEWQDAMLLKAIESVRFDPERLADYEASVEAKAPGCRPRELLDWFIARLGGRSQ